MQLIPITARSSSRPRMSVGFLMPVIPNCSDWIFKLVLNTTRHNHPVLSQSIYPVYLAKKTPKRKPSGFLFLPNWCSIYTNKKRPQTGVSFRSHTHSHVIIMITIYIMFVKLFFMFCTATWTSCGWIIISWRSLSLSILPAWAIRISRACVIFWT